MAVSPKRIDAFDLAAGRVLAGKYVIDGLIGSGWEGEVYRVTEISTGIPRAAKVFYPQRNVKDGAVRYYARKLNRLRRCPILIQYHHSEPIRHRGLRVTCLISELVDGELLESFVARQPGKRLAAFEALHLLHALAAGLEQIHHFREYHGDLHDRNVLVRRRGVRFELKLLDFYPRGRPSRARLQDDVVDAIRILYDVVGGPKRYASQPAEIKAVCCGLRRDLLVRRFPSAAGLRSHLESFAWGPPA
jgi:serine/threonine protein kinase